jgi:oligopeptide/dipeptide ABC transporter ATP-binding protein
VVEQAAAADFFERPAHPYSAALLSASVDLTADISRPLPTVAGQPPVAGSLLAGCAFRSRCLYADEACATGEIELHSVGGPGSGGTQARCIRPLTASTNRGQHAARLTQGVIDG